MVKAFYKPPGGRKRAVARVRVMPGDGKITVNGRDYAEYFPRPAYQATVRAPLEVLEAGSRYDVIAQVDGGGPTGQAEALRHGIARALAEESQESRGEMKGAGLLTRDARAVERKKYGLKKARKRPQFSKR